MNQLLVFSLLLAGLVSTSYGLKCYTCEGHDFATEDDDECGDTFVPKESLLKMCNASADETFCRKRKSGANHIWTKITRGCASQCEDRNIAYVDRVVCCKGEACNSGYTLAASVTTLIAACILALLPIKVHFC